MPTGLFGLAPASPRLQVQDPNLGIEATPERRRYARVAGALMSPGQEVSAAAARPGPVNSLAHGLAALGTGAIGGIMQRADDPNDTSPSVAQRIGYAFSDPNWRLGDALPMAAAPAPAAPAPAIPNPVAQMQPPDDPWAAFRDVLTSWG